ncbi:ABC transporter permease [Melghirimyces algeriensis]|uniref:ABC-2 type transport system permease protein n=1 Tax=Melghirimyces algeriensis TaxID=910412 RepID=A0A521CQ10_9BACL|nr:ABC transporter permease [Melghirimyces algeriensis]SMO61496.1 ABC-2 type transport system permease protein [Melghirimyces algeriensis]
MFNFIRLVQNENMKIFRRVGTWVMIGLLLLATVVSGLVFNNIYGDQEKDQWKEDLQKQIQQDQKMLQNDALAPNIRKQVEEEIKIKQYRIDHSIAPDKETLWGFIYDSVYLSSLIILFTIIVGGTSVAGEFSWGTIKLLLIRSASRSKILLSKYLSTLLFALAMLGCLFLFSMLVGSVFFGVSGWDSPHLMVEDGNVIEKNRILHIFGMYGLQSVDLLMMVTFAFMISTVFRSSSLAIGLAIFLMFSGNTVVSFLAIQKVEWVKYTLFANTNLSLYLEGAPLMEGMTLSFSITVLAVYFVIFNIISWIVFNKRDVAA